MIAGFPCGIGLEIARTFVKIGAGASGLLVLLLGRDSRNVRSVAGNKSRGPGEELSRVPEGDVGLVERALTVDCTDGREYTFMPAQTALLLIDMQLDFLDPHGMCGVLGEPIDNLRSIVPTAKEVLAAVRDGGMSVVHTREGYAPDLADMHALKRKRFAGVNAGPLGRFLIRGEPGQDIIPELSPRENETVIDKPGFGAFYCTDLEEILKARSISHLLLAGVTTQCCVHSTLREAVDRGFACLTLSDCCAAFDPTQHDAAIGLIHSEDHIFGWVSDSARLLQALGRLR